MILNFEKFNLLEKFSSSIIKDLDNKFKEQTGDSLYKTIKHALVKLDKVSDEDITTSKGKLPDYESGDKQATGELKIVIGVCNDVIQWVIDTGSMDKLYKGKDKSTYDGMNVYWRNRAYKNDQVCDVYEIKYDSNIEQKVDRNINNKFNKEFNSEPRTREKNLNFKKIFDKILKDEDLYDKRFGRAHRIFTNKTVKDEQEFIKYIEDHIGNKYNSVREIISDFNTWNTQIKESVYKNGDSVQLRNGASLYQFLYILGKLGKFFE